MLTVAAKQEPTEATMHKRQLMHSAVGIPVLKGGEDVKFVGRNPLYRPRKAVIGIGY